MKARLLALSLAALVVSSSAAAAQPEVVPLLSVAGAPFSGVRSQQSAKNFVDGNRIDRGGSVRLYRDGRGRTRVERDLPAEVVAANPQIDLTQIVINDAVTGERIELRPKSRTAFVIKGRAAGAIPRPTAPPGVFLTFAGRFHGPDDAGWAPPVSLGEKSIDGLRAIGARREYTLPVGAINNEKPVKITVEQWYSPDLALIVKKSAKASLGGELDQEVENIVQGEPDPTLFTIPPDYSRVEAGGQVTATH